MKKKITFLIGVLLLAVVVWGLTTIGLKQAKNNQKSNVSIDFRSDN